MWFVVVLVVIVVIVVFEVIIVVVVVCWCGKVNRLAVTVSEEKTKSKILPQSDLTKTKFIYTTITSAYTHGYKQASQHAKCMMTFIRFLEWSIPRVTCSHSHLCLNSQMATIVNVFQH